MLIQISDLLITEKLHERISGALLSLLHFIKTIKQKTGVEPTILIAGNIFSTRTYLSAEDIHFFEKIMGYLANFSVILTVGPEDLDRHGMMNEASFSGIIKSHPKCAFISKAGVYKLATNETLAYITSPDTWPAADYAVCRLPREQVLQGPLNLYKCGIIGSGGIRLIDQASKVAFNGPFVQNRAADGIRFGCTLWNGNGPQFVPLPQAPMELLLKFVGNKELQLPTDIKVLKAILRFKDCDEVFIKQMEEDVARMYSCTVISIDDKMVNPSRGHKMDAFDPHSLEKHLEAITTLCPAEVADQVAAEYRRSVQVVKRPAVAWRIRYLVWDNIYCYREGNHINFEEMHNLTFIVGANRSGKSTIVDLVVLAIFGVYLRGDVRDLINKFIDKARIKCCFVAGGSEYVVQRFFRKGDVGQIAQKFCLIRNGEDITPANLKELYTFIGETLNVTLPTFKLNIIQQGVPLFVDMSRAHRKEMLLSILNLGYLKPLHKAASSRRKELQVQIKAADKSVKEPPSELAVVERAMEAASKEIMDKAKDVIVFGAAATKDALQELVVQHGALTRRFKQLVLAGANTTALPTELGRLKQEMEFQAAYEKCVNVEGIPLFIFQGLLGHINGFINSILDKISDFHITIVSCFEIYTVTNQKKVPASMASGYQKFLIEVCMRITLLRILPNLTGFDLLFIDEGFGCLDKDNFLKVSRAVDLLKQLFKIVIITHVDELHSYAEDVLHVQERVQYGLLSDADKEFYPMKEEIKKIMKRLPQSHLKTAAKAGGKAKGKKASP